MSNSNDLMLAILAMNAYDEGYDPGIGNMGSQIGTAAIVVHYGDMIPIA